MPHIANVKNILGTLIIDTIRFIEIVLLKREWWAFSNRWEKPLLNRLDQTVVCNWQWTSKIAICELIPYFGKILFKQAASSHPFKLQSSQIKPDSVKVSVIIGHRGNERIQLLVRTLQSFYAQSFTDFEIILVEHANKAYIDKELRNRHTHIHAKCSAKTPYSRALTFNMGAKAAKGKLLLFHDNDLLVSQNYLRELWLSYKQGHQFINLKRFIFYLSKDDTDEITRDPVGNHAHLTPEFILHNAEGGGSLAACKKTFNEIGGMDESFIGWGGEDNEFWERAKTKRLLNIGKLPLIHLWHPPQSEKTTRQSAPGVLRYHELSKISPKERIKRLRQIRQT